MSVRTFDTVRRSPKGEEAAPVTVAEEVPVAIEVNGIGFAVMMASPADLEDFARGFVWSEGLHTEAGQLTRIAVTAVEAGIVVRLQIDGDPGAMSARVRTRITESACGLCGLDSLAAVHRPLPMVVRPLVPSPEALARAYRELSGRQVLGSETRAAHAAALCKADGGIALVREDVGRHNAMDKLIGAALEAGTDRRAHFALVTSRLSFELVEKAALAGFGALAAISAPTSLALDRARACGLPVISRLRGDSYFEHPVVAGVSD